MKIRNVSFWVLAVVITLASLVYQKKTGPTHPVVGKGAFGTCTFDYELLRSRQQSNAPIELKIADPSINGTLVYKRYHSSDAWTEVPMQRNGEVMMANLPMQPPAGKLEYFVRLNREDKAITLPADRDVVIRFTGNVPGPVLATHILLIVLAMLLSTRAGLEAAFNGPRLKKYALWALGILLVGGMIMGPIVQKYAFGEYWTGVPFGYDLTDNKTLIAFVGWIIAIGAILLQRRARTWTVIAAVLLMLAFSIPHSMMGSELNYNTGTIGTAGVNK